MILNEIELSQRDRLITDYREMIAADLEHLWRAIARGDSVLAHGHLKAIIGNSRLLEDLMNS